MSLLIVTSRYLKSGTKAAQTKRRNYTTYIATREGVEKRAAGDNKNDPSTQNQKDLLNDLLNDFPEAVKYLEYEDYIAKPTVENTSELISTIIERNADVIGNRQNFVGYMAMRPGAVKRGAHGLFNDSDAPIILNQVANEVANHPGNVWSHVVSLRRADAVRLGFDNSDSWRELVKKNIDVIAKSTNIKLSNLKWYAAFHDTTHHPHIHLIVYSTDPKEGFLSKDGIEKIRSSFANQIFHDDLESINQEQTLTRDQLKILTENEMKAIISDMGKGISASPKLFGLIKQLKEQLSESNGKKIYGYLKRPVKQTVDSIFAELAANRHIQIMYEKWCDFERERYKLYTQKEKDFPPITENPVFKSVKNMIIRNVLSMENFSESIFQPEPIEPSDNDSVNDYSFEIDIEQLPEPEEYQQETTPLTGNYYINWSKEYKSACKLIYAKESGSDDFDKAEKLLLGEAEKGNVLAIFDFGKFYTAEKYKRKDAARSESYYVDALKGFMQLQGKEEYEKLHAYICYRIGKMYCYGLGTAKDEMEAFKWFEKSAAEGNKFAQFSIGNCYYYGSGTEQSYEKAFLWYMTSAEQGQPYAQYALAQMFSRGEAVLKDDAKAKEYYEKAFAGFKSIEASEQADDNLLYKIGQLYKQGLGTDTDTKTALDYFRRAAELNNKNALYEYGKALLLGKDTEQNKEQGLMLLQKAIDLENINAKRFLALEYISGENIEQDIDNGIEMLTELADGGDNLAAYKLGRIYLAGEVVFKDIGKAEKYLQQAADGGNEIAVYALAKLYLMDEEKDISKAAQLLEKACGCETIKSYAAYTYAKLLTDDNELRDSEKALSLLEETADDNNWCSFLLGQIYAFGKGGIEKDKEKAVAWLTRSAEAGNEYAGALLQHIDDYEQAQLVDSIFGLFVNLSRLIEDDYSRTQRGVEAQVDRKLRKVMDQKKAELGIKADENIHFDY